MPSVSTKRSPRCLTGTLCAWQSRHSAEVCAGSFEPRRFMMSFERSLRSTVYDRACLSRRDHVTYSFCKTLEFFHEATAPWHRLLEQLATPTDLSVAFCGSVAAVQAKAMSEAVS